jgi:hypothetical protein
MLKLPDILPAWMYRDPLAVADSLIDKARRDARKREAERRNKHLRIAALTRKAMNKSCTTF